MSEVAAADQLSDLAERFWRFQCAEYPFTAILAGEAIVDAVLFRESPADYERRYLAAGQLLEDLARIPLEALAGQDRATHQLLRGELEDLRSLHEVMAHFRPPLLPVGPDFATVQFANTAAVDSAASAARYVERLATLPDFLSDLRTCLEAGYARGIRYPKVVLDAAAAVVRGTLAGTVESLAWYGPFIRSSASGHPAVRDYGERTRELISRKIAPAIEAYAAFLSGPLARGARDSIACTDAPLGQEFYRAQVRHFTSTDLAADEIHELGLMEVERLEAEIAAIAAKAGFAGDVAGYRSFLTSDPQFTFPSSAALREKAQSLAKRIDQRIPSFFGRIPRITYGVESMPEALAKAMPAAYAQPNPADGSTAGIYWLTSLPEKFPAYLLLPTTLHEAWPGHLMHLALLQELAGLPAFRRHGAMRYSAYLEGWALYCEGLGEEMGLYETTDQHYGRYEMELWRAARLVVDTGIHTRGWSRDQSVAYMAARLAMPIAAIESEVDRYIALPGQALAYQIGNLRIRVLRRKAEAALGDTFRVRQFHDELLAAGPVSLPVLDEVIDAWIQRAGHE